MQKMILFYIVENICVRLKKLREGIGLSQRELARELNMTHASISRWENGKREPDAQSLYKLAQFFEVSMEYLMGY